MFYKDNFPILVMGFGDIFKRSWEDYGANFKSVSLIMLIFAVGWVIMTLATYDLENSSVSRSALAILSADKIFLAPTDPWVSTSI